MVFARACWPRTWRPLGLYTLQVRRFGRLTDLPEGEYAQKGGSAKIAYILPLGALGSDPNNPKKTIKNCVLRVSEEACDPKTLEKLHIFTRRVKNVVRGEQLRDVTALARYLDQLCNRVARLANFRSPVRGYCSLQENFTPHRFQIEHGTRIGRMGEVRPQRLLLVDTRYLVDKQTELQIITEQRLSDVAPPTFEGTTHPRDIETELSRTVRLHEAVSLYAIELIDGKDGHLKLPLHHEHLCYAVYKLANRNDIWADLELVSLKLQRLNRYGAIVDTTTKFLTRIGYESGPMNEMARINSSNSTATAAVETHKVHPGLAYIGLGSNMADRLGNINAALNALNEAGLAVLRTSALYETAPMYVQDQAAFMNAVCEIKLPPGIKPLALLDKLKELEDQLGRVKTVNKGPRVIDLDILLHGQAVVDHDRLVIPHHSMLEREFVLRPLADLIPNKHIPGQGERATVSTFLNALPRQIPSSTIPIRPSFPTLQPDLPDRKTHVMAILNLTPDSFSDGGKNSPDPQSPQMQGQLAEWLTAGATIFDIGGQSTRPRAPLVSAQEELERVIPTIKYIRSQRRFDHIAISIDTFRASVAAAAVEAGADIVNDVSAGTLDVRMLPTVAKLAVPIILMHMRGNPDTMMQLCDYPNGLIDMVAAELEERVRVAMRAGIPRWRIILDPGIGFAKKGPQNIELLRRLDELREYPALTGFPWLVGTSRKAFIGDVTGVKRPSERGWGTAAAVSAAVQGGADIVRVHDVGIAQTVRMADAIWRNPDAEQRLSRRRETRKERRDDVLIAMDELAEKKVLERARHGYQLEDVVSHMDQVRKMEGVEKSEESQSQLEDEADLEEDAEDLKT